MIGAQFTANSFALVEYIPGVLGTRLNQIRCSLPGHNSSDAHVTFLPRRPLRGDPEETTRELRKIIRNFAAFDIHLTVVKRFPVTNLLYIDIDEGRQEVSSFHDALNHGSLAGSEQFEFSPHVTLCQPPEGSDLDAIEERARMLWTACDAPRYFRVQRAVFVQQSPEGIWTRLWTESLTSSGLQMLVTSRS